MKAAEATLPPIRTSRMIRLARDPKQSAVAVNLIYVTDRHAGLSRIRRGRGFSYYFKGKKITDPAELRRIRQLRIPPAWRNVWICRNSNGHIQATGLDARNRKQYRYHTAWNTLRNQTKFSRLQLFGEKLPLLRMQVVRDLAHKGLDEKKVLATIVSLMERTFIQVGNSGYERANGSYGLTTLKDHHVKISGDDLRFTFRGKSGKLQHISLHNRRLAHIVKQCRDIPGKELFQYLDAAGHAHSVDSGKVNAYIKAATGEDFTAKDFRTWAGTLNALQAFRALGHAVTEGQKKQNVVAAVDYVSAQLGNTRAVCRKYYIHPCIIGLYEREELATYLKQLNRLEKSPDKSGWAPEERVLLNILRSENS